MSWASGITERLSDRGRWGRTLEPLHAREAGGPVHVATRTVALTAVVTAIGLTLPAIPAVASEPAPPLLPASVVAGLPTTSAAVSPTAGRPITRLIVRTTAKATPSIALRAAAATGAGVTSVSVGRRLGTGDVLLGLAQPVSLDLAWKAARALTARGDVVRAEPDIWMTADGTPSPVTPADPLFAQQWDLWDAAASSAGGYGAKAPAVWGRTRGSSEVVVAVIDTGITAHPELDAAVVAGYDFVSDPFTANDGGGRDSNPADPGDWVTKPESSTGCPVEASSWHGTHVAGTIAAAQGNGVGISGIAPGVRIQPVRALGKCGGSMSDIIDAITWASGGTVSDVASNATPAQVINMSLGGSGKCATDDRGAMQTAVDGARTRGTTVVVAAGNSNVAVDSGSGSVPANCDGVVTVAATGRNGARASYSNFGTLAGTVALAAPGGDGSTGIVSTLNTGTTSPATPTYASYQGTSMATPHVAAAAALIQSTRSDGRGWYTPDQVKALLQARTQPFPSGSGCSTVGCGAGILDLSSGLPASVPSSARGVVAQPGDGRLTVSWLPPLDGGGSPVDYTVQVSADGGAFSDVATVTDTALLIDTLTNGTSYVVRVTASNASGDGASLDSGAAVPLASPPPLSPTAVTVTGGVERLNVSWAAGAAQGSALVGYRVRYRKVGAPTWVCAPAPGDTDPCTASLPAVTSRAIRPWPAALAAGRYEVEVVAANTEGFSAPALSGAATVTSLAQTMTISATALRPFRDGFQDSVAVTIRSNVSTTGSASVLNARGQVVLSWPLTAATAWSRTWTGNDARGRRVPVGVYRVRVLLVGRAAAAAQVGLRSVTVAASAASRPRVSASSTSVYPVRDRYRDTVALRVTAGVPASTVWVLSRGSRTIWTKRFSRRTVAAVTWNGRDRKGKVLAAGRYRLKVTARGGEGSAASSRVTLAVSGKKLVARPFQVPVHATTVARAINDSALVVDGSTPGSVLFRGGGVATFSSRLPVSVLPISGLTVAACGQASGATGRPQVGWFSGTPNVPTIRYASTVGTTGCWKPGIAAPSYARPADTVQWFAANTGSSGTGWQINTFVVIGTRYALV